MALKNIINIVFTEGRMEIRIRGILLRQFTIIRCRFAGRVDTRYCLVLSRKTLTLLQDSGGFLSKSWSDLVGI